MKTQKLSLALLALVISLSQVVLTSCGSNKVVSSSFIQKRKYTGGYHFNLAFLEGKKYEKEEATKSSTIEKVDPISISEETLVAENDMTVDHEEDTLIAQPIKEKHKYFLKKKKENILEAEERINRIFQKPSKNKVYLTGVRSSDNSINTNDQREDSRKVNGLAIASLCCSVLWLFGIGSIGGVIFGAIALRKIRRNPEKYKGEGLAVAGFTLGVVGLFITVILLIILYLKSMQNAGF